MRKIPLKTSLTQKYLGRRYLWARECFCNDIMWDKDLLGSLAKPSWKTIFQRCLSGEIYFFTETPPVSVTQSELVYCTLAPM